MMIIHNIIFETVNCTCCKDNSEDGVPKEIIDLILKKDEKVQKQEKQKEHWICVKYRGIISRF